MKRTDITEMFPEIDKEKLDRIMDLNGADVRAAKAELDTLRGQLTAAQTELAGLKAAAAAGTDATAEIQALKDELGALKNANALRDLREAVSKESGVPASLLTGDTEEACRKQAEAIKAYSTQASGYPAVRDGGEVHQTGGTATRDKFADYFNQLMKN